MYIGWRVYVCLLCVIGNADETQKHHAGIYNSVAFAGA